MTELMNQELRAELIRKASNVVNLAAEMKMQPEASIAAALSIGLAVANELHAISVALEWANELTVEGRNRA